MKLFLTNQVHYRLDIFNNYTDTDHNHIIATRTTTHSTPIIILNTFMGIVLLLHLIQIQTEENLVS